MSNGNHKKCITALLSIKTTHPNIVDYFEGWCKDAGYDDDNLYDEFVENDFQQCEFIADLVENERISTDEEAILIWQLLHNALSKEEQQAIEEKHVDHSSIVVDLLSIHIDEKEKSEYIESRKSPVTQKIKEQAPLMLSGNMAGNKDILLLEYIGYKNKNYPLLLHFVDSYTRCQMNEWIKNDKQKNANFSIAEFFNTHCKNIRFVEYLQTNKQRMNFIQSAMASYQHRVLWPFGFMHPTLKIMDANPLNISHHFFDLARIVLKCATQPIYNFTHIIPVQIDFVLINGKIQSVETKHVHKGVSELFGDTEIEDDVEEKTDLEHFPNDIGKLLDENKIEHKVYDLPSQDMLRCTEDIKLLSDNKRYTRSVFVLDQRRFGKDKQKDKLYLFRPTKCNTFKDNELELLHCSLHHNSIKSMVPRKGRKADYSANDCVGGEMFVVSFHVMSKEEIRCYIFYQTQCFRFYGEDLINVLPIFFDDAEKAKDVLLTAYHENKEWRRAFDQFCDTFVDKRFDAFYDGLTGSIPRINVYDELDQDSD